MRCSRFLPAVLVLVACGGSTSPESPVDAPAADSGTDALSDGAEATSADSVVDLGVDAPCDCLSRKIEWKFDGGFGPSGVDSSSLTPCRAYQHRRDDVRPDPPPPVVCNRELEKCGGTSPNVRDIEVALAHPDMVAAVKAAPVLYGKDSRPVDGQVFRILVDGKTIDVGGDCGGTAGCTPVPPGVQAAAKLLQDIDTAELALSPCKEAFAGK